MREKEYRKILRKHINERNIMKYCKKFVAEINEDYDTSTHKG